MKLEFKGIYGQKKAKDYLTSVVNLLREEKVDSLFLEFVGPEGVGKLTTALVIANAVNCEGNDEIPCGICPHCIQMQHLQHPDLILLIPDMNSEKWAEVLKRREPRMFYNPVRQIRIDEIRDVEKELWRERPYSGKYRFVIVVNGENLNQYSQNAFLKTLEEPYPRTVIIFIVSRPERILPTIHSRARKVRFDALSFRDFQQYFESFDIRISLPLLYRITFGSIGKAKRFIRTDFLQIRLNILKAVRNGDAEELQKVFRSFLRVKDMQEEQEAFEPSNGYIDDFIDFYGSIARDLLYIKGGLGDFIINLDLKEHLEELAGFVSEDKVLEMLKVFREASFWLKANVDESVLPYALIAPIVGKSYQDIFRSY